MHAYTHARSLVAYVALPPSAPPCLPSCMPIRPQSTTCSKPWHVTPLARTSEFNSTREFLAPGAAGRAPLSLLGMAQGAVGGGGKGPGFLRIRNDGQGLLTDEGLTLERVRECYEGWTAAAIAEEMDLMALHATTVWVPQHVGSIPAAVERAAEGAQRIGVGPGDYEWPGRLVIGIGATGAVDARLRLAGGQTLLPLPIPMAADDGGETRLWGQWAMNSNSWGSLANVTCLCDAADAAPRGSRALFLITGGTAPFPWVFHSMQARCSGGVAIVEAQRAFLHTSGCVIGGLGGGPTDQNATAVYGVMLLEDAHMVSHASTLGYCCVSGVRVTGSAVCVLDKCRLADNARGLMLSDDVRCLLRACRFLANWFSAIDVSDGSTTVGGLNAGGDRCRSEVLLQGCRVRAIDAATKASLRKVAVAAAAAAEEAGASAVESLRCIGDGFDDVWMGRRLPGWLSEKNNDFPGHSQDTVQADESQAKFRTEVVFRSDDDLDAGERVSAAEVLQASRPRAADKPSLNWVLIPGVVRLDGRSLPAPARGANTANENASDASEAGEHKVEYIVQQREWEPRGRVQALLDEFGCRKVMASWQILNDKPWMHPLRLECTSSVLLLRNTSDHQVVVEWDKVKEGRKFEVLVACPACERSIKVRSGLLGTVKCPLPGCGAIFERQQTPAAVSIHGLADNIDELLHHKVVGENLNEADPRTHAILPLPGGKLAVVRRPLDDDAAGPQSTGATVAHQPRASVARTYALARQAGAGPCASPGQPEGARETEIDALAEASRENDEGEPQQEEKRDAILDWKPAENHTTFAERMGSRWIEDTAAALWKDDDDVEWDASSRSKLVRPLPAPTPAPAPASAASVPSVDRSAVRASRDADEHEASAQQQPRPAPSGGKARVGAGSATARSFTEAQPFEGPEVLESLGGEKVGETGQEEAVMPLHLMAGNGTGDAELDAHLKQQGIRFTGADRPFGMPDLPSIPVKPSSSQPTPQAGGATAVRDYKDVAAAAEDARRFEEVYDEYVKRKGADADPALVQQMRGFREMLAKRVELDRERQGRQEDEAMERSRLSAAARVWGEAVDMAENGAEGSDTEEAMGGAGGGRTGDGSGGGADATVDSTDDGADRSADLLRALEAEVGAGSMPRSGGNNSAWTGAGWEGYTSDQDEDKLQGLLLESCSRQLEETERVFTLYVKKMWKELEPFVSEGWVSPSLLPPSLPFSLFSLSFSLLTPLSVVTPSTPLPRRRTLTNPQAR